MADEQVVKLLEEIRDLQKQHLENYKDAIANQRESLELYKRSARRQRITQISIGVIMVIFFIFLLFLIWVASHPAGTPYSQVP